MSATGSGLTQISNVNLAAGGAAGSQINFTHNLGVRAVQVYCSDAVTGRQLDGTEISVAQPTANVVQVANVTTGAVVVNVSIRFQYDSVEENAVLSTDSRIVAAVGPPPVAAGIVGGGAANQVTYWTGAAAISGNAFLTTDPATGDLDRIKNVPYDWPAANAVGVLTNDGAGNLTWAPAGAAGANTALSNLAAVAVNAALNPGADNARDFGTAALRWRELWVGTSVRVRNNTFDTLALNAGATFDITADVDLAVNAPNLVLNGAGGLTLNTTGGGTPILAANGGQIIATSLSDIQLTPAATFNVAVGLDGTAALPALTFGTGGDPDTGIFRPLGDMLAISTAGVERTRWSTNGDVTLAGGLGANRVLWDETNAIFQVGGTAYNVGPATTYSATNIGAVDGAGNPTTLNVSGAPLSLQSGSYVEVVTGALLATFTADNAVQLQPGDAAAVSAAGTGRFRYNSASNTLQFSNNGGAYQNIGSGVLTVGTTNVASGAANRILYEGAGNLLQESANLTFDGTGVGIGTAPTTAPLTILGNANGNTQILGELNKYAYFAMTAYDTTAAFYPIMDMTAGSGSIATPGATQFNFVLGMMRFGGYRTAGGAITVGARIYSQSTENWGASVSGTLLHFGTTQTGTTGVVDRMTIYHNGNVGIGTTTPQSKLDVEGGVAIGATYSGTTAAPTNGMIVQGIVGIGTGAPTAQLELAAGVTGSSGYHVFWTGALGSDNNVRAGLRYTLTTAGTGASAHRIGIQTALSGTSTNSAAFVYGTVSDVSVPGVSNNLQLSTATAAPLGNVGTVSYAYGTTTGLNVGGYFEGANGNLNIGMLAKSVAAKNSATNVGVFAAALNTGSSPVQVAGYFGLVTATPTLTSAALIADNGTTTSNIFEARDNGTAVVTVADAGAVTMTGNETVSGRRLGASAAIVAANDLTLGVTNLNIVSGNTQINALTTAGWTAGSQVTLVFSGTPTVKHNTAGGAGTAVMLLAGSVDLVAAANTVLSLVYDGTAWQETSRKVA